ncbi:MAG: tyrosine-type recombinase/integrase [Thermoplasmata archaeon]|nr:tyrosine-type recombinase/integrase [Thermoplasmata archaeon]
MITMGRHRTKKVSPKCKATLENFLAELLANQAKPKTLRAYRYLLMDLSNKYPTKTFEEISKDDLRAYFADMSTKAASTVNQRRSQIKKFYKWLEGDDEDYPSKVKWLKVKQPSTNIHKTDLITKKEMDSLLGVARDHMERLFLVALYETGARISEFCSVRLKDLRINSDEVILTITEGKTGPRVLTVVKSLKPLKVYLSLLHPRPIDGNAFIFYRNNRPVNPGTAKRILDELTELAGIERTINPHLFRHTRATELAKANWNESKMRYYFGWKSTSHMPSIYTHLAHGDTRSDIRKMEGLPVEDDGMMTTENLVIKTGYDEFMPNDIKSLGATRIQTLLESPEMAKHLDELIRARVKEQYGDWKTQVQTGELSEAMDNRTDRISIAVKKAVAEVDKTAVVESIEVTFPEVQKMQKK